MNVDRPTEAEKLVEGSPAQSAEVIAADVVAAHLTEFGPAAKVMIITPTRDVLRDALDGEKGLFRRHSQQFSQLKHPYLQFNHKGGGQVSTLNHIDGRALQGRIFSLIWAENVRITDEMSDSEREKVTYLLEMARHSLRIGNNPRILYSTHGIVDERRG